MVGTKSKKSLTISQAGGKITPSLGNPPESVEKLWMQKKQLLSFKKSHQVLEPVLANEEEARLLGIRKGRPVLAIEGITFLTNGRPVEYVRGVYHADRCRFFVELYK